MLSVCDSIIVLQGEIPQKLHFSFKEQNSLGKKDFLWGSCHARVPGTAWLQWTRGSSNWTISTDSSCCLISPWLSNTPKCAYICITKVNKWSLPCIKPALTNAVWKKLLISECSITRFLDAYRTISVIEFPDKQNLNRPLVGCHTLHLDNLIIVVVTINTCREVQ